MYVTDDTTIDRLPRLARLLRGRTIESVTLEGSIDRNFLVIRLKEDGATVKIRYSEVYEWEFETEIASKER